MFEFLHKPHVDPVKFPMLDGYWPVIILLTCYLLFVLKLGKLFMANRKPYDLKKVLKVYNMFQIIFNSSNVLLITYIFIFMNPVNIKCLLPLPADHSLKYGERILSYAYFLNKVIDLLDTIFIVLRKSYRQITVLHLVHHVYMVCAVYGSIRFNGYGGHPIFTGYVNLLVHSVMYGYYYLSATYPSIKQTSWKKYMTIMQMIQFVAIFGHAILTNMQPDCDVSPNMVLLMSVGSFIMFVMFSNFYIHAYVLPKKPKISTQTATVTQKKQK